MATYTLDFLFDEKGSVITESELGLSENLKIELNNWNRDALPLLGPDDPDELMARQLDTRGSDLALRIFENISRKSGSRTSVWVSYFSLWKYEDIVNYYKSEQSFEDFS